MHPVLLKDWPGLSQHFNDTTPSDLLWVKYDPQALFCSSASEDPVVGDRV